MTSTIIIVIVALACSAFFSGMEIAFVSANKLKVEIDRKRNPVLSRIIGVFLRHPGQYLTTILVGNNIALVVYSLNMTVLLNDLARAIGLSSGTWDLLLQTLISTVILIFTAEFTPKAVAKLNPNRYLNAFAVPIYLIYLLLYPIAKLTTLLSVFILRLFGMNISRGHHLRTFDRIDLANLLEEASEGEGNPDNEIRLFQNALDFAEQRVRDCMVPRVDMEAIGIDGSIGELTGRFVESKYSRIFVYRDTIDNIVGYVNSKSLFKMPSTIGEVVIPTPYVPGSMLARTLLTDLTRKRQTVAVVIDEFGGTAGMVSMEDILEEIFGDIEDEHDSQDLVEQKLSPGHFVFSCRLEVEYLNEKYGLELPESDQYDTLAGLILFHHEGIPSPGEVIEVGKAELKVVKVSGSRIDLAKLRILK